MADLRITNCHIHTFTMAHVPRNYPARWLRFLRLRPEIAVWLGRTMGRLFGRAHPEGFWPRIERLGRFGVIGKLGSQEAVLQSILSQYSTGTRFVVLPMDMAPIGHGPVAADLQAQHDELSRLARSDRFAGQIIPFATLHPARDGAFDELRRAVETLGFRGLKLYPKLGFEPTDPLLMDRVYPYCLDHDLPVTAHCSRGGVAARGWEGWRGERACDPQAWVPVLTRFPGLRVCLAHFGGDADWRRYIDEGIDPLDPEARRRNWLAAILDMLRSGAYPGLWTDISYTIFNFEDNLPFLRVFLTDERVASRVLFGSDYYMTRQERLSERAISFRLRDALGETLFRRIAETNPAIWLGEPRARPAV